MGISVSWDITYRCNLFCEHCINGDLLSNTIKEPSLEEVKQIIDHLCEKKIDYVHLLGGEPTVRKDFIEILNYFDNKGIPFGFNTNGLIISSEKIMQSVTRLKKLKNIIFSIEGPTAEINDAIRGKAVFEKVIVNLKKLIEHKKQNRLDHFHITINTVVSKTNKDYILEMINYCVALGVDEIVLLQLITQGNAHDKKISLSFEDELKLVGEIADIYPSVKEVLRIVPRFVRPMAIDYANKVLDKEFPDVLHGCGAGTEFAYITNQGELYPCNRYKKAILEQNMPQDVSLVSKTFDDIWKGNGFSDIFANINKDGFYNDVTPCNGCSYLRERCYPCPAELINSKDAGGQTEYSCTQYSKLIQAHYTHKDYELAVTKQIIREALSNDEAYTLFHTETFETLSLNKEAYLIWNELRAMDSIRYNAAIKLISSKHLFTNEDVKEVIDYLIDNNYLEKVA